MANNFSAPNFYTTQIPSGSLTKVELTQPQSVKIQWPNPTGGIKPATSMSNGGVLRKLFG